jgi:hypothetical protein
MKSLFFAALVAGLFALPTVSSAQDASASMTHAEVQTDLASLEQAGYRPNKLNYPADIQTAEARLNAQNVTTTSDSGVGGVLNGASQASAPTTIMSAQSIYTHH